MVRGRAIVNFGVYSSTHMREVFVSCAVIVNDQDEYLLIQRARDPYEGHWSFISGIGASKKGLSPEKAVLDEVKYDIGAAFTGTLRFSYPLPDVDYADQAHVFVGTVNEQEIKPNPEAVSDIKWFGAAVLRQMQDLAFDDKWLFEKLTSDDKGV